MISTCLHLIARAKIRRERSKYLGRTDGKGGRTESSLAWPRAGSRVRCRVRSQGLSPNEEVSCEPLLVHHILGRPRPVSTCYPVPRTHSLIGEWDVGRPSSESSTLALFRNSTAKFMPASPIASACSSDRCACVQGFLDCAFSPGWGI